jgi:hypothetical protein
LEDLRVMLSKRGVMSIPACVLKEAAERTQGKAGDNLTMISEAFRGSRKDRIGQGLGSGKRPAKAKRMPKVCSRPAAKRRPKGCRKSDPVSDGEPTTEHRSALPPEHALLFEEDRERAEKNAPLFAHYRARAEKHCHDAFSFEVYDLGMYAGRRTNACFWLAFAAGWVSRPQAAGASRGTAKTPWTALLQPARKQVLAWTSGEEANRRAHDDSLGQLADAMRQWFCADGGYMHGAHEKIRWMPNWTEPPTQVRSEASYGEWLERVAEDGFADELIVSAVSGTLCARIVVVPAEKHWALSEYGGDQEGDVSNTVYLGNDNMHFVWLRPRLNDVTPDAAADVAMADDCPVLPFASSASTG